MEITSKKFLTSIKYDHEEDIRIMSTQSLREICGVNDIEEILQNSIIPDLSKNVMSVKINGTSYLMSKLLEATDLSIDILRNVLTRASKVKKQRKINLSIDAYVKSVREIILLLINPDNPNPRITEEEVLKSFHLIVESLRRYGAKKYTIKSESIIYKPDRISSTPMQMNLSDSTSSLMALSPFYVDKINEVLRTCWFYHKGEKLYITPVEVYDIENAINLFKSCQTQNADLDCSIVNMEDFISLIIGAKLKMHHVSGVMTLQTQQGEKKMVSIKKVIPMPTQIISSILGENGAASSWKSQYSKTSK